MENAIDWPAIQRLARTGVDWFCAYAYGPDEHPADLILDLDSTDDPTHGTQQLALFHGWYDQHMYHPLVWFEGRTGLLLRTRLRPGRDPSAACVRYDRTSRPIHLRTSFWHRAKSWPHHRRILVKIDVTAQGLNVRFMVTNRRGRAADLVAWYDDRGTAENWIKELKLDLHADRLSCHRFRANAFRLQLHRPYTVSRAGSNRKAWQWSRVSP